jgi:hypothetical protein
VEIQNGASKTTSEIDNKNQLEEQFITSQVFHRTPGGHVQKITVGEKIEPQILELFNLVAQESNQASPAMIYTRQKNNSQH